MLAVGRAGHRGSVAAWELVRRYPIAACATAGLAAAGAAAPFSSIAARVLLAAVTIGGGIPLAVGTLKNMAQGRFHVDTIATLAIIGAAVLGQYLAGALVVLMQSGGESLEDYGLRMARHNLDNLLKRAPSIAHRKQSDTFSDVPARDLAIGDIILVRAGDILAADGVVVEGHGEVDESALTGEPVPLGKTVGDVVFSGTINLSGSFLVRTTNTAAQSKYERIVRMVQHAQGERAPVNRLANRYTPAFTVLTLSIALFVLLITTDRARALSVLVVATPCPLIIATPLAVLSAISRAASLNIITKSGAAIERSGSVDTVVFDKTGTLTSGEPAVGEIRHVGGNDPAVPGSDAVLRAAAAVELLTTNVLGGAVVKAARARGLPIIPAMAFHEMPGTGVSGAVGDNRVSIGSADYLEAQGVPVPDGARHERMELSGAGKTVAYFGMNGSLRALLIFEDRIRPEAARLIERLKHMGVRRLVMLTGDTEESAHTIGGQLAIPDVRSRLTPEDKVAAVKSLGRSGTVMMIGDGINDAPALAAADVGVAMGGHGAGIATDAAEIVITVDNVERVADTIALGRRMVRVARQGIFLGIGASFFLMMLASAGFIRPAVGALLQEAVDLAAILNALRAR